MDNPEKLATLGTQDTRRRHLPPPKPTNHHHTYTNTNNMNPPATTGTKAESNIFSTKCIRKSQRN